MRYNFDGILSYEYQGENRPCNSYLQVFKNGIVETVDSWIIQPFQEGKKLLYIEQIEDLIINFIYRVPKIYEVININPPLVILLTITGVYDYELGTNTLYFNLPKVGKDILIFPDILIEDWTSLDDMIKPLFDTLWNSVGIAKSNLNFNNGKWIRKN